MNKGISYEKLALLYVPYAVSLLLKSDPYVSYFIAWLGSFYIFFITLTGAIRPLPDDRTFSEQLMRPIIIVQIVFAGYMCCTSIFYFLNLMGYEYLSRVNNYFIIDQEKVFTAAQCQRYYCLGHAAFVSGILIFMKYPKKHIYIFEEERISKLLFYSAIITFPLYKFFDYAPGLSQFSTQFSSLSFMAGTLALAFAIPQKNVFNTVVCIIFFGLNLSNALTSGYKEPIIVSVMVLGIFLYSSYKKLVLVIFIPVIIMLFTVLPTYVNTFRDNAWSGETSEDAASQLALQAVLNKNANSSIGASNWEFLVGRLSEIDMFTTFVESTPDRVDFYNFDLLKQAGIAVIPRIIWPSKPITEDLVMERVYTAGVVYRGVKVSAKPAFVVDAYLSYGTLGVFLALFIYGAAAQLISQKAEELFGGYLLGTALIFSGLFQIFWRGLSFEFLVNSVFWSYITMLIIHRIFLGRNIIQPA